MISTLFATVGSAKTVGLDRPPRNPRPAKRWYGGDGRADMAPSVET
jgi:hypothetical protein